MHVVKLNCDTSFIYLFMLSLHHIYAEAIFSIYTSSELFIVRALIIFLLLSLLNISFWLYAELPLEPSLSRTLMEANEYGCLSQALTVAAMLSAETTLLPGRRLAR